MPEPAPFALHLLAPGDEPLLDRIAPEVFDAPVRRDWLMAYLAAPGHLLLVALTGGVVIGQCAGIVQRHPAKPTELYVDEVGVTPDWQRQGIARAMLRELFRIGRDRGCKGAWLGTEPANHPARALYRAIGSDPVVILMFGYELDRDG